MTLDVTIGKVQLEKREDDGRAYPYVKSCPEATEDITSKDLSFWPRESYRSGSTAFWNFWYEINEDLAKIYNDMRDHPSTNDRDVTYLEHYVDRINGLNEKDFGNEVDKDRLQWLKYWVNKAVELYGKDAGISFT